MAQRILLIVSGGIAAYKSLELIRLLRGRGYAVRCILTAGGRQFVTPLSLAALSEDRVYEDLFSLTDEAEMGHIRLSRAADLVVVAPASADILAKMAAGMAESLATTALLATDKPVLIAPAMNVFMWAHPATQANIATLAARGIHRIGPNAGDLACGEVGAGRMAEPAEILARIETLLSVKPQPQPQPQPLAGRRALVTSGPTYEAIDPVRFIGNRSSGKQGHAIAAALAAAGAVVTLISGPTREPDPPGVAVVPIESAREMLAATQVALPADIAVFAAAVADWRVAEIAGGKIKKAPGAPPPPLHLIENPDILATIAGLPPGRRPGLVIGFAAETGDAIALAQAKRARKGCDWIIANDVSPPAGASTGGVFGAATNQVHLITADGVETWPDLPKEAVAARLVAAITAQIGGAGA